MMWRAWVLCVLAVACGKHRSGAGKPGGRAERFGKLPRPPATPLCQKARARFGYAAACVETPLPELTTAAGKVFRVHDPDDATRAYAYALVRPGGEIVIGSGGYNGRILDEITEALDLHATAPEVLAKLYAELVIEAAVVRCLPGETLPTGKVYQEKPCVPPAVGQADGKNVLTFVVEEFPHPALLNRTEHWIYFERIELEAKRLSSLDGAGMILLDPAAPLPPGLPPLPVMTSPPDWVAVPVAAPADLDKALCAEASTKISGIEGRKCKAYGYPSLTLPAGAIYYLANDAGQRYLFALKKPDGKIVVGFDLETSENPITPLIAHYDAAVVPPTKLLAAQLLLSGTPARILCLPGAGDELPGETCKPPIGEPNGDDLVIKAILEELPIPDQHGNPADPAVRAVEMSFGKGGGYSGGGFRLIDMRDD